MTCSRPSCDPPQPGERERLRRDAPEGSRAAGGVCLLEDRPFSCWRSRLPLAPPFRRRLLQRLHPRKAAPLALATVRCTR